MSINPRSPDRETPYPFLSDVAELRRRARQHIYDGAVSIGHSVDRETVLRLCNEALATELVCVRRYQRDYFMAGGALAEAVKAEFLQHAQEEQGHADQIAERIVQLGGTPSCNLQGLAERSHAEHVGGEMLAEMLEEDLIAERIAIENYREIIQYLGNDDITTRQMLESILVAEEEHAEDLRCMREDLLQQRGRAAAGDTDDCAQAELQ